MNALTWDVFEIHCNMSSCRRPGLRFQPSQPTDLIYGQAGEDIRFQVLWRVEDLFWLGDSSMYEWAYCLTTPLCR